MNIPTTQLWLGEHNFLLQKTYAYATSLFGIDKKELIIARQFHKINWFAPEKNQYTKADLEPIFYQTSFALDPQEHHLIILEHADMLTSACANMLLKLLEEPPIGYHFILLAQRIDTILPTIRSRSIITDYGFEQKSQCEHFLHFFKNPRPGNHIQVMQELEKIKITEYQSRLFVDQLLTYWSDQYIRALKEQNSVALKRSDRMMRICQHALEHPPMPGSNKIFWRNIYLFMTL